MKALWSIAVALALACTQQPGAGVAAPDRLDLIEGRVVEQVDSPPYAFLRVETAAGHVWTAVPIGGAGLGADVRVTGGVAVRNHRLAGQDRRLDVVYFGRLAGQ